MVHISEREEQLPDHVIGKLLELLVEDPSVLSLGAGEPDFPLPPPLVREIKRLANSVNHYSPPGGLSSLKQAIAKKVLKDNKIKASADNVVVTCGSQEALMLAAACTLDVSEQILIPNPGYLGFSPTFQLLNASCKYYSLKEENDFQPDPDEIRKHINRKKTKVIILNSPSNPTGTVIKKKILEEVADLAIEYDLAVFSDEAYEKVIYDDAKHVSFASLNGMQKNAFTFQSFSKSSAMCGFRVGYAVVPKIFAAAMKKEQIYSTICSPTLSQKLAIKALQLPRKYVDGMVKEYDKRRKVIVHRLNDMGLPTPMPKGAFYTFSNIKHVNKNSKQFSFELLKKHKVAVVPGIDFGKGGEGYIRCSFATKLSTIQSAMDRLEKFLGS